MIFNNVSTPNSKKKQQLIHQITFWNGLKFIYFQEKQMAGDTPVGRS